MEVQEIEEVEIESTPSLIREPPVGDVPPPQHINEVMGWQNALPSEWVPIISQDSQRQRRQSPQGPFSDAYLSGMPSKRRKLITSTKPQGNLSQVISGQ
ncbi:Large proline-rich protein bag6 [Homalodisca vitripennis]|nr:Large proline-rich protein bag6 [Homalodisca vitripennis]